MAVSALRPADPPRVGPFLLLGRVADGGMGVVYLGREDGRADSLVVVKTARPEQGVATGFVERLRSEARVSREVAARADPCPGLVRFVSADPDGTTPWIATEYVPGPSLHAAARGRELSEQVVSAFASALAEAIAELHRFGYAHRDVKPANVVLGPDGARLVDLGLAVQVGAARDPMPMGSPGWSPPEQIDAGGDPRPGDVHGWGMSVAYASVGRPPFGTGPAHLVTRRMLTGEPRLSQVGSPLRDLLSEALRADPLSRPTADDVVNALASLPRPGSRLVPVGVPPWRPVERTDRPAPRGPVISSPTQAHGPPTLVDASTEFPDRSGGQGAPDGPQHGGGRVRAGPAAVGQRVLVAAAVVALLLALALVLGERPGPASAPTPPAASRPAAASADPSGSAPGPAAAPPAPVAGRTTAVPGAAHAAKGKGHRHKH
jgi:eukaryotic-like serine/threonine-protein kinase